MNTTVASATFSVNEAACVTGIPVKQVHRIIDARFLDGAARESGRARAVHRTGLVGLKLAHETADLVTREGRRLLVRYLLDRPDARTARMGGLAVDLRPIRRDVRNGLAKLARARAMVRCDNAVLSGTPCIRGTRIPVHYVADMLANGDSPDAIGEAFPQLGEDRIALAALYASAYPRRGRPKSGSFWRDREPAVSTVTSLDALPPAR